MASIVIATLVLLANVTPSAADPILVIVTSGAPFTFANETSVDPFPRILLAGTSGFTFESGVQLGVTGPGCCLAPGTTTSFFTHWIGDDMVGTATLLGETVTFGSPSRRGNAHIEFQSSMFTLPSTGGTSFTITAPFTLTGGFSGPSQEDGSPVGASFIGSGIGTVPLTWIPTFNEWAPGPVLVQVSTPVPEPVSIVLVGTAFAGAYAANRFRRRTRATHKAA